MKYITIYILFYFLIQHISFIFDECDPFHQGPFHHIRWRRYGVLKIILMTNIK